MGLCLSGGGYRAMLFHTGSVWRLYEAGLLR
jgi:NTE family protein